MKSLRIILLALASICASLEAQASDGQIWLRRARQGDVNAMYQTALRYFYGTDGLLKNVEKARYWAELGGEKGNTRCMTLAAQTYGNDELKAAKFDSKCLAWNVKAAEAGSIDGVYQARENMWTIKHAASTDDETLRALKGQIYWNEQMLAHPDIMTPDYEGARKQSLQIRDMLQKEFDEMTAAPEPEQDAPEQATPQEEKLFIEVEQAPQFPRGDVALYGWLARNIRYPAEAVEGNIQGRVTVQCIIEKDGSVGEVKVVRGKHPALDKEAVRLVKSMPKFTPGLLSGQPVRVWYTLPITFKLN